MLLKLSADVKTFSREDRRCHSISKGGTSLTAIEVLMAKTKEFGEAERQGEHRKVPWESEYLHKKQLDPHILLIPTPNPCHLVR